MHLILLFLVQLYGLLLGPMPLRPLQCFHSVALGQKGLNACVLSRGLLAFDSRVRQCTVLTPL